MSDLLHLLVTVQINKVNWKLHPEGVDAFTRDDPQTFSRRKHLSIEKAFSTFSSLVSYINAVREFRLSREIGDP